MSQPHDDPTAPVPPSTRAIVLSALVLNVLLLVAAFAVYMSSNSQLVLAQGSDSVLDIGAGIILTISAWVSVQPRDENHPFGHERAEPIGALVTAVLAGVLAFEVLRSSVSALITGEAARMDLYVAAVLAAKFAAKALLLTIVLRRSAARRSSALHALRIDTRNDVVACGSSLVGFALARYGWAAADAALAIPVAFYIGASGFELARDNLRYLMGEAPEEGVLADLHRAALDVFGVLDVGRLRAHYTGPLLHVEVAILIGAAKSATQGHDIAVDVQKRLEEHDLVGEVFVHVDTRSGKDH